MAYNALLVHNRGFAFFWIDVRTDLSACVHGMDIFSDFATKFSKLSSHRLGLILFSQVVSYIVARLFGSYKVSHFDVRYKQSLLKTILDRAFKLPSNWQLFYLECERLTGTFSRLL